MAGNTSQTTKLFGGGQQLWKWAHWGPVVQLATVGAQRLKHSIFGLTLLSELTY
jgi:hypothetical protein